MGIGYVLKLAGKFALRGFVFKAGKKAAIKGGNVGIGIFSILAGGYMAYTLLELREKKEKEQKELESKKDAERIEE